MNQILEVGTKIRSYDFFGVVDYYIEGVIVDVDTLNRYYGVKVLKQMRGGDETIRQNFVDVDFMGQRMVDDKWNRIEVIA